MSFITKLLDRFSGKTNYISGSGTRSRPHDIRLENDAICNAILDCNATHIARGQVLHVVKNEEGRIKTIKRSSEYTKLFSRPNRIMTGREFLYSMAWQLQVNNMAFAWVRWDRKGLHPLEVYPLIYLSFRLLEKVDGSGYAVKFFDPDGFERIVDAEDLIVIRRKYDGNGFVSTGNGALSGAVDMVQTLDDGLINALNVSNKIHGILKQKNSILSDKSTEERAEEFVAKMKLAGSNGGIVAMDSTEDYQPLNINTWAANAAQAKLITDRIYTFWRTPEEVVKNTASEQIMMNYFDSIIEPVWEEMGEAMTKALFTTREQDFGNAMVVTSAATTGASWQTKLNIIANTKEIGLLTTNQYLELLGYPPVPDGDERLVSLNYVKSSDQTAYQTGKEPEPESQEEENENGE